MNVRPATEKQFAFIKKLLSERELDSLLENRVARLREKAAKGQLGSLSASDLINDLLAAPRKASTDTDTAPAVQAGVYRAGSLLVRVYLGQQSGQMLAKRVDVEDGSVSYEYLGLARKVLSTDSVRLSLEEVGQLGIQSGTCLICGRRLDDPESVDRGIGPVCAANYA